MMFNTEENAKARNWRERFSKSSKHAQTPQILKPEAQQPVGVLANQWAVAKVCSKEKQKVPETSRLCSAQAAFCRGRHHSRKAPGVGGSFSVVFQSSGRTPLRLLAFCSLYPDLDQGSERRLLSTWRSNGGADWDLSVGLADSSLLRVAARFKHSSWCDDLAR